MAGAGPEAKVGAFPLGSQGDLVSLLLFDAGWLLITSVARF